MTATTETEAKTPAKKTPAKKKPAPIPASENAPRGHVVEQTFVFLDDDQGEVRLPLRVKFKFIREMVRMEREDGASEMEQLVGLLDALGDKKSLEQLDEMWLEDANVLIDQYFEAFSAHNKATPGE